MQPDGRRSRHAVVADTVARLGAGEPDALAEFFELAVPGVRRIVLRAFQTHGIWIDSDRLDDVVRDCIVDLLTVLPSWRADGGALPWSWAAQRVIARAHRSLGALTVDIEEVADLADEGGDPVANCHEDVLGLLARLAAKHPEAAALHRALDAVPNERDRRIWLDLRCEEAAGNERAAVTVAARYDLSHANVRKIRQRVSDRLAAHAVAIPA